MKKQIRKKITGTPNRLELCATRESVKNLTQAKAAKLLNVTTTTYQRWELGESKMPAATFELFVIKIKRIKDWQGRDPTGKRRYRRRRRFLKKPTNQGEANCDFKL